MLGYASYTLLHSVNVRPALVRIFDYRQQVFASLFGDSNDSATSASALTPPTEERAK